MISLSKNVLEKKTWAMQKKEEVERDTCSRHDKKRERKDSPCLK
jgi:hypothetical protein